jgi:glucokinase
MLKLFDHVSFEHVCSGIGIPHLYRYLRDKERLPEKPEIAKRIDAAGDPSVVIIEHAFDPTNPSKLCAATIDLFVSILASEAGNLAVKVLAMGGGLCGGRRRCADAAGDQGARLFAAFQAQRTFR